MKTGKGSLAAVPTRKSLRAADVQALETAFRDGACPTAEELEGPYRGELLWLDGLAGAGQTVARAVWGRLWKGKSFARPARPGLDGSGHNLQLSWTLPVPAMPFQTRLEASVLDGGEAFVVSYPARPPLPRLRDELRAVGPGLYLGAMFLERRGAFCPVSYFSLRR